MTETDGTQGWCCSDCLMLLANGDTPPELNEEETAAWVAEIDRRTAGFEVGLGGEHDDDCPNMVNMATVVVDGLEFTGTVYNVRDNGWPCVTTAEGVQASGPATAEWRDWEGSSDCSCEEMEFSWRQCDTCGSPLGGSRHAVTFFAKATVAL